MCKWCDKDEIKQLEQYEDEDEDDRVNCIVYDKSDNLYHLWVECEDWYYSGVQFYDIEFCPYCGRKLK